MNGFSFLIKLLPNALKELKFEEMTKTENIESVAHNKLKEHKKNAEKATRSTRLKQTNLKVQDSDDLNSDDEEHISDESSSGYEEPKVDSIDDDDANEDKIGDTESIDSDNLDDEDTGKRKRGMSHKKDIKKVKTSQNNLDTKSKKPGLPECPEPFHAPDGTISTNTLGFLKCLAYEECNNRDWLVENDATYRTQYKEFSDFVQILIDRSLTVDDELPWLPARDCLYRLARDIRFSNNKTNYKTYFCATLSKVGRKDATAGYHLLIEPNNKSMFAVGKWQPSSTELASIRTQIANNPQRIRDIISSEDFVRYFGDHKYKSKGQRTSLFGMDDELKVAPKGFDKNHPDIDLLRLRSFIVERKLSDEEVLDPHFMDNILETIRVGMPLVNLLNEMAGL